MASGSEKDPEAIFAFRLKSKRFPEGSRAWTPG
jgi:hypothetical protein